MQFFQVPFVSYSFWKIWVLWTSTSEPLDPRPRICTILRFQQTYLYLLDRVCRYCTIFSQIAVCCRWHHLRWSSRPLYWKVLRGGHYRLPWQPGCTDPALPDPTWPLLQFLLLTQRWWTCCRYCPKDYTWKREEKTDKDSLLKRTSMYRETKRTIFFNPSYAEATFVQSTGCCKDFQKPSKPCQVGNHWKAFTTYSQMSTCVPGFQLFFRCFASFCFDKTSQRKHKG